jgi:hypothetical protein
VERTARHRPTFLDMYQLWEAHPVNDFPTDEVDDHYTPKEQDIIAKA